MRRLLVLFGVLGCGCTGNATQILLVMHLDSGQAVDQLQIAAQTDARTFPTVRRPEVAAATPLADLQSVAILLPDDSAGKQHTITIEGLRQGTAVATVTRLAVPMRGQSLAVEVWLGNRPLDGGSDQSRGDALPCAANVFLGCQGTLLQRCNATGSGVVTQDCAPFACNSVAGRCNECDPAAPAKCSNDSTLVECTSDGLNKITPCPLGCSAGACCVDVDLDSSTTCAGDCDDADQNAHPGQTDFFSTATKGKGNFDFNCDTIEEKEVSQLANCVRVGSDCQGHGWQGAAPNCGVQGIFITCKPSGPTSCSHDQSQKTQNCR